MFVCACLTANACLFMVLLFLAGREIHSCMFRMELLSVRPDVRRPLVEECRLRMEFLPLRLNIDQDTMEFFIAFFAGSGSSSSAAPAPATAVCSASSPVTTDSSSDVISSSFAPVDEMVGGAVVAGGVGNFADVPFAEQGSAVRVACVSQLVPPRAEELSAVVDATNAVTYFQVFSCRGLKICVDYAPKRVDFAGLRHGDYAQLVHLFPLEEVEIDLKKVVLHGVQGWDRLFIDLGCFWASDIGKHQAHKYLSGVQPIRSIVNVGNGFVDLVLVPLSQYKRDGRLWRGIRKGTSSFARSVAMETLNITARVALGAQSVLETVDSVFTNPPAPAVGVASQRVAASAGPQRNYRGRGRRGPVPPPRPVPHALSSDEERRRSVHRLANQPRNYSDGLRQAYESLSRGFRIAMHHMLVVPREEYVRSGTKASVKSMVRAVPTAVLRPMIGAAEAVSKALLGVQNAVEPRRKLDADDRYKTANQ